MVKCPIWNVLGQHVDDKTIMKRSFLQLLKPQQLKTLLFLTALQKFVILQQSIFQLTVTTTRIQRYRNPRGPGLDILGLRNAKVVEILFLI